MSQVSPYKERFSLSWLTPVEAPPAAIPAPPRPQPTASSASPLPPGMEAALDSIGNQVLSKLAVMPGQTSNLLNLASAISMRFEVLLPVVQHLASKGLIERTIEDPSGNDTYQLGNHVLAKLDTMPGQTSALLDLASISSIRFEVLLPIVQYLAGKGLLERLIEDPSGNDTYKIAQAGLNT